MTQSGPIPRHVARPFFRPPTEELRHLPECPTALRTGGRLGWVAIQHGSESREGSLNVLGLRTLENRTYPLPGRPGFFVQLDARGEGTPDIFVHMETVRRGGLSDLEPDQELRARIAMGRKGPLAVEVEPL